MKLFDWWNTAKVYLSEGFTFVGDLSSRIKMAVEWLAKNRAAMLTAVVAGAKAFYDFIVSQINSVCASLESSDFSSLAGNLTLGDGIEFVNSIIPISETFACISLLLSLWVTCAGAKMVFRVLSFVPSLRP